MGFTTDLVTGLAELLASAGVGTWAPEGGYTEDDTAIVVGPRMPQTPDRVVCLTPYPGGGDLPGLTETTVSVQVRCRGTVDPRVAEDLADAIYDALHGLASVFVGGAPVAQIFRASGSPLGPDTNNRHERSDNYAIQVNRASPYAID